VPVGTCEYKSSAIAEMAVIDWITCTF